MMGIDFVFLVFALMHGIAFAVLANDYIDPFYARVGLKVEALIACSVK